MNELNAICIILMIMGYYFIRLIHSLVPVNMLVNKKVNYLFVRVFVSLEKLRIFARPYSIGKGMFIIIF
jgi:hypothetical protein